MEATLSGLQDVGILKSHAAGGGASINGLVWGGRCIDVLGGGEGVVIRDFQNLLSRYQKRNVSTKCAAHGFIAMSTYLCKRN